MFSRWKCKLGVYTALQLLGPNDCKAVPVPLPNINDVTQGFNVLLGRTPAEQRQALIGSKLFNLSVKSSNRNNRKYLQYVQFQDTHTNEKCSNIQESKEVSWATSNSLLTSQSSSSSHGWDQETTIGVSVPAGGATVNAETSIRNAIVFGNSDASATSFAERDKGHTYSFHAKTSRVLYGVELDYESIYRSWTKRFKKACKRLGNNPSNYQVARFFKNFGTHGLAKANFGQKCTSSVFMESGQSATDAESFRQEASSSNIGFLWWTSASSQTQSTEEKSSKKYNFSYTLSNRQCQGEIETDSSCGGGMKGTGSNSPVIVDWAYKPIWSMNVPGFTPGAKKQMRLVFIKFMEASVRCMQNSCNGNGACAPKKGAWDMVRKKVNVDDYFDTEKCFCFDGKAGNTCNSDSKVEVARCLERKTKNEPVNHYNTCTAHPIDWYQTSCESQGMIYKDWQYCGGGGQYICLKDNYVEDPNGNCLKKETFEIYGIGEYDNSCCCWKPGSFCMISSTCKECCNGSDNVFLLGFGFCK